VKVHKVDLERVNLDSDHSRTSEKVLLHRRNRCRSWRSGRVQASGSSRRRGDLE